MRTSFYHKKTVPEQYATDYRVTSEGLASIGAKELLSFHEEVMAMPPGQEREDLVKMFIEAMTGAHKKLLSLAVEDELITTQEINDWKETYDCDDSVIAQLIRPYYEHGFSLESNEPQEGVTLLTMKGSGIHRMKDLAKERFNLGVLTIEELQAKVASGEITLPGDE